MADTDPKTEQNLESPFNRFVGAAIDDGIFFAIFAFTFGNAPASFYEDHAATALVLFIVFCLLWLNYFAYSESRWGMSLGKKVMGMRVVSAADGSKATFGACSIRNILRPIDYLLTGPLLIANTIRHQRLGDKLGHTIVISDRPPTRPAAPGEAGVAQPARDDGDDDIPLTDREHVRLAEPADPPPSALRAPAPAPSRTAPRSGPGYATVWRRSAAFTIDAVMLLILASIAAIPVDGLYDDQPELFGLVIIIIASLCFNYFVVAEWKWEGRTVGKRLVGIRAVSEDGGPVTFAAASMRNLMRLVDFFFLLIGPILILGSARRQRIGDQVAHTVVVRGDWLPGEPEPDPEAKAGSPVTPAPAAPPDAETKLPELTWNLRQTLWGVVGGLFLAAFVAPLLIVPFDTDLSSLGATLAAQALLTVALVGTAVFITRKKNAEGNFDLRATLDGLGWRRFKPKAIGQALLTLFVYYLLVAAYALVIQPEQEDIGSDLGLDRGVALASIAVFLICVVAPVAEETFFRGFVFRGLRGRMKRVPAALVSGLIFGGVHAPTGLTAVIPLAVLGTGLALLYERTGSIWPGIFAHALNNSIALAAS